MYGQMAKWVAQIDRAERMPEFVSHAFHTATSGRPGPVVLALPEDMLTARPRSPTRRRYRTPRAAPAPPTCRSSSACSQARSARS